MAYVNKRADIERQKAQQWGDFAGALINGVAQASVNEITRIQQDRDNNKVKDIYNGLVEDMNSNFQTVQDTYDPDQWAIKYSEWADAKNAEIEQMDIPNRIKKDVRNMFNNKVDEFRSDVNVAMANKTIALQNERFVMDVDEVNKSGNVVETAKAHKVKFVTEDEAKNIPEALGQQLSKSGKSFMDGVMPETGFDLPSGEDTKYTYLVAPKGSTNFDKKSLLVNYLAEKRWPENEKMRNLFVENNIRGLVEEQAKIDYSEIMKTEFNVKNMDSWDFGAFFQNAIESMESDTYGGMKLTPGQKANVLQHITTEWNKIDQRARDMAQEWADTTLVDELSDLREWERESYKNYILPEQVYDLIEKAPVSKRYANPHVQNLLQVAENNEIARDQQRWWELYNDGYTDSDEFKALDLKFSEETRAALMEGKVRAMISLTDFQADQKAGISYVSNDTALAQGKTALKNKEYATLGDFSSFLNTLDITSDDRMNLISDFLNEQELGERIELEAYDTAMGAIRTAMANETFSSEVVKEAFEGVDMAKYGDKYDALMQVAQDENSKAAYQSFLDVNMDNKATLDDVDKIVKDFGLDDGKHNDLIKDMRDTVKANETRGIASDMAWELQNETLTPEKVTEATKHLDKEVYGEFITGLLNDAEKLQVGLATRQANQIISKGGTLEQIQKAFTDRNIDLDKHSDLMLQLEDGLNDGNLKLALEELHLANRNNDITQAQIDAILDKHGVSREKYSQIINQFDSAARQNSMNKAENDMFALMRNYELTDEAVDEIAKKYGIDIENEQEFMSKWYGNSRTNRLTKLENELYDQLDNPEFGMDDFNALIDSSGLDRKEISTFIRGWEDVLENETVKTAFGEILKLQNENDLTKETAKKKLDEAGITNATNPEFVNKVNNLVFQEDTRRANAELLTMMEEKKLSVQSVKRVLESHGITMDKAPETYSRWVAEAKAEAENNAKLRFNEFDVRHTATGEDVQKIIDEFGLTEAEHGALITAMNDTVEENFNKHLEEQKALAQGYGDKDTEKAIIDVSSAISNYASGAIPKSEALSILAQNKGNITSDTYKSLYNDIQSEDAMQYETRKTTFNEKVYDPYFEKRDSILPEEVDALMDESGLERSEFADQYDSMMEQAGINQHNVIAPEYFSNSMYLELKGMGLSDELIEQMGFELPNDAEFYTLDSLKEGENPPTKIELAQSFIDNNKNKLLSNKKSTIDDSIKKTAKDYYDKIRENAKAGAKYDNIDSLRELELAKFDHDQISYNKFAFDLLMAGKITQDTYKDAIAVDVLKFNLQEKDTREDIETFKGYVKDHLKQVGKDYHLSSIAFDTSLKHMTAGFLEAYNKLPRDQNGKVNPEQRDNLMKRVYEEATTSRLFEDAENFMKFVDEDVSEMFKTGVFTGLKDTGSLDVLGKIAMGEYSFYDQKSIDYLLSDTSRYGDAYGTEASLFGHLTSMKKAGASDEEIGNTIMHAVARSMGLAEDTGLPDIGLDNEKFDKQFGAMLNNLPLMTKNQIMQLSAMIRYTVDITETMSNEIDPETIKRLDPNEDGVKPYVQDGLFGVQIGETVIIHDVSATGKSVNYGYTNTDGSAGTVSVKNSILEAAERRFSAAISSNFNIGDAQTFFNNVVKYKNPREKTLGYEIDRGKVIEGLEEVISSYQSNVSVANPMKEFLDTKNQNVLERSILTGDFESSYEKIEFYIDEATLDKKIADGTFSTTDLRTLIKYRAVRSEDSSGGFSSGHKAQHSLYAR